MQTHIQDLNLPSGMPLGSQDCPGLVQPLPEKIKNFLGESTEKPKQRRESARERLDRDIYLAEYAYYERRFKRLLSNKNLTPEEAAHIYWTLTTGYSKGGYEYRTEPFKESTSGNKKKVSTALEEGKLGRLLVECTDPVMYNLKYHHLGLPRELADAEGIFSHEVIKIWRERLGILLPKNAKYHYRFEVGLEGQLHVHLITDRITVGPLSSIKSTEVATDLYEATGAATYLYKPIMPWTEENLALRIKHERIRGKDAKFPKTRGTIGLSNRKKLKLCDVSLV